MLKNYFKIAIRNITKHKGYTAINLVGLITGMCTFIVIMLYVFDELSYDRFHKDADLIYRVVADRIEQDGSKTKEVNTPGALTAALVNNLPEISKATRLHQPFWGKALLANDNYRYYDSQFLYVDDSFFDVFSFSFIQGNATYAFKDPYSIVLTESLARRFFGDEVALGKTLVFNQGGDKSLKITGVIKDVPSQSHLQFDFLVSTMLIRPAWVNNWGTDRHMHTYIKAQPGGSIKEVNLKIQDICDKYENRNPGITYEYLCQPLTGVEGIHLSPRLFEMTPSGSLLYIRVLVISALFILITAGINYVNLATARSAIRAKEIGIRKLVGARRRTVISQILTESILISVIAGSIAIALTEAMMPLFNSLMQKELSLFTTESILWICFAAAVLFFGFFAGLYPAIYLSAHKPISIFRKQIVFKGKGIDLRKTLVVAQFALSACLLVGLIVVQRQMNYVHTADLGFDKDQVLVIDGFQNTPNRDRDFVVRKKLEELPGVIHVGGTLEMEIGLSRGGVGTIKLIDGDNKPVLSGACLVDDGYMDVFGLEFIEGRNFSAEFALDRSHDNIIVNEQAVKQLGIHGSALGHKILRHYGKEQTIIGVVKDFHTSSLHEEILPTVLVYESQAWYAVVKLSGGQIPQTLARIEEIWDEFVPDKPIDFYFIDEAIDQLYHSETNFKSILSIMTGIIIIIACLGLFGLVAYTAEQRRKEIGIRKVLGATVSNVITLLSGEFVMLVVLANLIAWPAAWIMMNKWLQNFAYHIEMTWWTFVMAGSVVLMIALFTAAIQAIRAAIANPVESLRYE